MITQTRGMSIRKYDGGDLPVHSGDDIPHNSKGGIIIGKVASVAGGSDGEIPFQRDGREADVQQVGSLQGCNLGCV